MAYAEKKDEVRELRDKLKLRPEGAYLFWGKEEYLKQHYLNELRAIIEKEGMAEFNRIILDFQRDATLKELDDAVDALPVMAEHNLIEVWGLDLLGLKKEGEKRLLDAVKRIGDSTFLVIVMRDTELEFPNKKSRERKIIKELDACLTMTEFPKQSEQKLLSWVDKIFRTAEIRISDVNITRMIKLTDYSMLRLKSESEKLISYCKFNSLDSVPNEIIDVFVKPCAENQIFEFSDAIIRRSKKEALEILENLKSQNTEPIVIASTVAKTLNGLALLMSADKSVGDAELARLTGFFVWHIRKNIDALGKWTRASMKNALILTSRCESELKSIRTPDYVLIEALTVAVTGA